MELRIKSLACLLLIAAVGCGQTPVKEPISRGSEGTSTGNRIEELEAQIERLEAELDQARDQATRTELRRIDAEARFAALTGRYEQLSAAHEEAVAEVVRAQAKLRGSVSQADAASNIAEAEIALAAINEADRPQAEQAQSLLEQATAAFAAENYGGALYLSNQAKRLLSSVDAGPLPLPPVADEVLFAAPLPLVVTGNSNIRSGPGLDHPVLTTLTGGTRVEGYSYRDSWVRVRLEDGADGWVFQSLVAEHQ